MSEAQALKALHDRMDWYVDQSFLPCVETIILRDLEVIDRHRSGFLDLDVGSPLPEDAIYRMYSNSKLVTTVAVMMLVERGLVKLDAPIADYLPAFSRPQVLPLKAPAPKHQMILL